MSIGDYLYHFSNTFKINPYIINMILDDQKRKKENEIISKMSFEEFQKHFNDKILASKLLGEYGYIPSMYKSLDDEDEIKKVILSDGTEERIMAILFKDEEDVQSTIKKLDTLDSLKYVKMYFDGFKKQYEIKDYTAAAFYLSSILDNRFRFLFRKKDYVTISRFLNEGVENIKVEHFNKLSENERPLISNVFLLAEFIPALISYISRLFDGDKNAKEHFGKAKYEPSYLERNWLVHGFRTKPVKQYEVLQLLNAVDVLEEIIIMLK